MSMRIVIVGLGQTGQELAKEFIEAGHEIIVIDTDKELVENFTNNYDAIGVVGSGASKEIQLKLRRKNMRVITGSARGMVLRTLEGDNVRPTTDKVKEAVFSAIQFEIEGRRILDLFAGSGQLGIEALSRGAKKATFSKTVLCG